MSVYVGLDIGGTKLMVAAADADGRLLRQTRAPTPLDLAEGLDALLSGAKRRRPSAINSCDRSHILRSPSFAGLVKLCYDMPFEHRTR